MREIRFRAKRKLNGEWVYGSFVKGESEDWDYIIPFEDIDDTLDYYKIRIISNTVGQYTGMKDNNGNELYEGDVIRTYMGNICVIKWDLVSEKRGIDNFQYTGFCFHNVKMNKNFHMDVTSSCELIGNIHEHPELLKP